MPQVASEPPAVPRETRERALRVNFAWLVRLRFGAVLGQLAVILSVSLGMGVKLPLWELGAVMVLELALNAWAVALIRRERRITEWHITLGVGGDLLLFSALLYFSGGPANPFSFLYLIHIALAALVLPQRVSFALVASALACSLGLFFAHVPLPHDHAHHEQHYSWHLQGMWVAFGLAACFIVYFIQRVLKELSTIEQQLASSRERAARNEAVAALAMLSAGAAHELSSPLSTIALASGELLRRLPEGPEGASAREDVVLIKGQVERCRAILDQLSADAGQAKGARFDTLSADQILERALDGLPRERLLLSREHGGELVTGPLGAVSQALRNLVSNALYATAPDGEVRLRVARAENDLLFEVEDDGPGMSAAVLARATEPFFSTKPRGRGMGLGLFLAQSVADQLGGRLELDSTEGRGTLARLRLPRPATNGRMATSGHATQAAALHG